MGQHFSIHVFNTGWNIAIQWISQSGVTNFNWDSNVARRTMVSDSKAYGVVAGTDTWLTTTPGQWTMGVKTKTVKEAVYTIEDVFFSVPDYMCFHIFHGNKISIRINKESSAWQSIGWQHGDDSATLDLYMVVERKDVIPIYDPCVVNGIYYTP